MPAEPAHGHPTGKGGDDDDRKGDLDGFGAHQEALSTEIRMAIIKAGRWPEWLGGWGTPVQPQVSCWPLLPLGLNCG